MTIEVQRPPAGGSSRPTRLRVCEPARARSGERGSATLVVLALLFLMAAFALGNNRTLHQLHQELDLLEQHQLRNPESVRNPRPAVPVPISVPAEATPSEQESSPPANPPLESPATP